MKRILYYNWAELDSDKGGGVTVYQRNIVRELLKRDNIEVTVLSSGRVYNPFSKEPYIENIKNKYGQRCKTYRIVNSPVLAPIVQSIENFNYYLKDKSVYQLLKNFIQNNGYFDIIHFNNMEGLPISVLELKEDFPQTKFIYSLHNYFAFCPQVALWKNGTENCLNNNNGVDCVSCYKAANYSRVKKSSEFNYIFSKYNVENKSIFQKFFFFGYRELIKVLAREKKEYRQLNVQERANIYTSFIENNIEYFNKYFDLILAVSERVKKIAINKGLNPNKIITSYIGTAFGENQLGHSSAQKDGQLVNIIYLGYMRKDKGFYFLLDALKRLNPEIRKKISISFASKITDKNSLEEMNKLKETYADVNIYDGYNHSNLKEILTNKHLGIVPVLWEDNLPQVAIEMISYGVPILSSDLGGASELCNNELFRFTGGDIEDFNKKLEYIVLNNDVLNEFWKSHDGLKTMNQHLTELEEYYFNNNSTFKE